MPARVEYVFYSIEVPVHEVATRKTAGKGGYEEIVSPGKEGPLPGGDDKGPKKIKEN